MSATAALLRGRAKAESLMLDTCTITRVTGSSTNRETGVITPTTTTVYTGICKVQHSQGVLGGSPKDIAEAGRLTTRLELHLPASVTGVRADDRATITAAALDAELVGRVFVVRSSPHKSFLTARRLEVEELTS